MKVKLSLIVAVAFVFSLAMFAYAQEPQQQQQSPPPPGPSSLDVQGINHICLVQATCRVVTEAEPVYIAGTVMSSRGVSLREV